jgi:cation diffusion facilitator family transporter
MIITTTYLHVLADALTSVLTIAALLAAFYYGWVWMDPAVGIVGACVILSWSVSLIRSAGMTLLDMVPEAELASRIREKLEVGGDRVTDLHLWRVGPGHTAVVGSIVTDDPRDPSVYKAKPSRFISVAITSTDRARRRLEASVASVPMAIGAASSPRGHIATSRALMSAR